MLTTKNFIFWCVGPNNGSGNKSTDDVVDIRPVASSIGIGDGDFAYLLGHPEDFLNTKAMDILMKASWNSRVSTQATNAMTPSSLCFPVANHRL